MQPDSGNASRERVLILEPGRAELNYWSDLWSYRELFAILAWRDVAVQYKQTAIGALWAVIRPLLTALVFTGVFGGLAGLPTVGAVPYPILVMAGMLPWFLFATVLGSSSSSLVNSSNLISKIYFPRLIVPIASCLVGLVDFAITLVVLFAMMAIYGFAPDWRLVFLPLFVVLAMLAALGPALILTALNVKYRDFRFIVPFIIQFGLYVSPVGFASSVIPEKWRLLYSLNPVVGVIDGFRWAVLGGEAGLDLRALGLSVAVTAALLLLGIRTFRATEKSFADLI